MLAKELNTVEIEKLKKKSITQKLQDGEVLVQSLLRESASCIMN